LTTNKTVYTNRIVFQNPGRFYIDIEKHFKEVISKPRNPVIARMFRWAKLAENAGYGFDKMQKWKSKIHFETYIDYSESTFELDVEYLTPPVNELIIGMLNVFEGKLLRKEIQQKLNLIDKAYFLSTYLQPALEQGYIATEFANLNHPKQRYYLTEKGKAVLEISKENS
jgi:ATP-dependent DNA helicase RecG